MTFEQVKSIPELQNVIKNKKPKIKSYKGEISETLTMRLFQGGNIKEYDTSVRHQDLLNELINKLVDIVFVEPFIAFKFSEEHPGQIMNLRENDPVVLPGSFMIKKGDPRFRDQLDYILLDLLAEGFIQKKFIEMEKREFKRGLIYSPYHPRIGQAL